MWPRMCVWHRQMHPIPLEVEKVCVQEEEMFISTQNIELPQPGAVAGDGHKSTWILQGLGSDRGRYPHTGGARRWLCRDSSWIIRFNFGIPNMQKKCIRVSWVGPGNKEINFHHLLSFIKEGREDVEWLQKCPSQAPDILCWQWRRYWWEIPWKDNFSALAFYVSLPLIFN